MRGPGEDKYILQSFNDNYDQLIKFIDNQDINSYVNFIMSKLFASNKYFNDQEPWKKKDDIERLHTIVYVSLEIIRKVSILLNPIIPNATDKVLNVLSINTENINIGRAKMNTNNNSNSAGV